MGECRCLPATRLLVRSIICSCAREEDQLAGRVPFRLQSCADSTLRRLRLGPEPQLGGSCPVRFQFPPNSRNCREGICELDQAGSGPCMKHIN